MNPSLQNIINACYEIHMKTASAKDFKTAVRPLIVEAYKLGEVNAREEDQKKRDEEKLSEKGAPGKQGGRRGGQKDDQKAAVEDRRQQGAEGDQKGQSAVGQVPSLEKGGVTL